MTKSEAQAADYRAEAIRAASLVATLIAERDMAIRERDALRVERITQDLIADRFAEAVAEADTLRARVAFLEKQLEFVACRAAKAYVSGIDVSHWQPLPSGPG